MKLIRILIAKLFGPEEDHYMDLGPAHALRMHAWRMKNRPGTIFYKWMDEKDGRKETRKRTI